MKASRREGRQPAERRNQRSLDRGDQPGRAIAPKLRLFLWPGCAAEARTRGSSTDTLLSPPTAAAPPLPAHRQKGTEGWQGRRKVAPVLRYLIRAATLMLGAVRVRVAGVGGSHDVIAAGPRGGVRSAACSPAGSAAPPAACGTPGRGSFAILAPCPWSRNIPFQKKNGV